MLQISRRFHSPMTTSIHLQLLFLITTATIISSAASPPFITSQDHQHADRIIEAMIGAGDFRDWAADFLSAVDDQFGIPLSATIFIPSDFDAADLSSSGSNPRRLSVAYHIIPQRLSFTDLRILLPLSRLPTLLPGNSIVVTNNTVSSYTLDGVLVSEPDLFLSSSVAIHGVASPLDFSCYGELGNGDTALADGLSPRHRRRRRPTPHGPNTDQAHLSTGSFLHPLTALALFCLHIPVTFSV